MKNLVKKLLVISFFGIIALGILVPKIVASSVTAPQVTISSNITQPTITLNFSDAIPVGNIVDIEVYNTSNTKVWQYFTPTGGATFSATTNPLPQATYFVSVGLFTPNWSSNYAWFDHIATIGAPTPTPTLASQNNQAYGVAINAYNQWKAKYVIPSGNNLRVVRPENNNDTVSEGIGYGMLLSVFANDQSTFSGLWHYAQQYLDGKGLMNWDISSNGSVIGNGSATDADEDMAYALVKASSQWSGQGYDNGARNLITAMKSYDVSNNYINPGDNWGNANVMNPSYIAPHYYKAFAAFNGDNQWNDIENQNSNWLSQHANSSTGFLPDWLNQDGTPANISFDSHTHDFYYDASRVPMRLLMDYQATGDQNALNILQKQASFLSSIGSSNLLSGYTMWGQPITGYFDVTFLTAYTSAAQINPSSFAQTMINKLTNASPTGYFDSSLRAIALFVFAGKS